MGQFTLSTLCEEAPQGDNSQSQSGCFTEEGDAYYKKAHINEKERKEERKKKRKKAVSGRVLA